MASAQDFYDVPLTSTNIYVQGAQFVNVDANGMNFNRFTDTIYNGSVTIVKVSGINARTTTGVKLTLYTRSDTVKLTFKYIPDQENRGSHFGLYQNGTFIQDQYIAESTTSAVISLVSQSAPGELVRHDVVLPNWANPILSQLELKTGAELEAGNPFPDKKIVFLGDSITHGTGQSATYKTYPFLTAEALHAELFNLAVGGGKISPPVADLLQYFESVDDIWILAGYNNWQSGSESVESITNAYESLLATVRMHQPSAEVFCSTLTYTTNTFDLESGVTVDEVRNGVAGIVNARIAAGDTHLHLVHGEDNSDVTFLSDAVHFTETGAAEFAANVTRAINGLLPFTETFEIENNVTAGSINGQNNWVVTGTATVQSSVVYSGSQAVALQNASISHALSSSSRDVWYHFNVFCSDTNSVVPLPVDGNAPFSFYVDPDLNLVVYSNQTPVTLNSQIQTNEWIRFDVYCDYSNQLWNLSVNGTNVAAGLPFYFNVQSAKSVTVSGIGYVDLINVFDTENTVITGNIDFDNDDIPDWWELKYFGGITNTPADGIASNGFTYLYAYIAGLLPDDANDLLVMTQGAGRQLSWIRKPGRIYDVYWTPDLTSGFQRIVTDIQSSEFEDTDVARLLESAGFYQIRVRK